MASNDTSHIQDAVKLAAASDVTLIFVGLDGSQESETKDRKFVRLPGVQDQLVEKVTAAAKGKVALIVGGGGAVDLSAAKKNPKIGAILWTGYPGQAGGQAIADILFGVVSPSGKLTQTWYDQEWADRCSMLDMNMRPSHNCPSGRSHRFYTGTPVYAFGHGLSYTTFDHSLRVHRAPDSATKYTRAALDATLRDTAHRPNSAPTIAVVKVTVSNTGDRHGACPVLLFVRPPLAGVSGTPLQTLASFDRVSLAPGEATTLDFALTAHHFALADEAGQFGTLEGDWEVFVGIDSADEGDANGVFRITE